MEMLLNAEYLHTQTFWLVVSFVALLAIMWKFVTPMLTETLDARANQIREDLDRAANLKTEAEQMLQTYEKQLKTAQAEAADLVAQSQLVVTTTPARMPVLKAEWLHEGLHITAMGADQTGKNEIDPRALALADLYVADRASQVDVSGELEAALAAGAWPLGTQPVELGDVITGKAAGRQSEADITICDLTGTGAQDTAIATYVAQVMGDIGTKIRS